MRPSGRAPDQLREISFETEVSRYAEGSCLVKFGNTHVMCTASVDESVPRFLRGTGRGWVTAEYSMLPRSTHTRNDRESTRGKPSGRTQEIQRLIGRSLRSVVDLKALGERQIVVDCDVIQADGGTRTASITGGYVALYLACEGLMRRHNLKKPPLVDQIAAVSCGIYQGNPVTDLDYEEDSVASVDANFVMTNGGKIVEVQGTAEGEPFEQRELLSLLNLATQSIEDLCDLQRIAIENAH